MKKLHLLSILPVILTGLLLYGPSLRLLLFWDDIPHMLWLDTQLPGVYWLTSSGFPFYRPGTFFIWELLYRLFGQHDAFILHLVSVILHISNALLISSLVFRLSLHWQAGFWSGMIFVIFPYSYQTVIPTAAHFHLMQLFGLLLTTHLLWDWYQHNRKWRLILAWLVAFWAIFCHENGIMAPFFIGLILVTGLRLNPLHWIQQPPRRLLIALAPIGSFSALYGIMWAIVPKASDAASFQTIALDARLGQTGQAIGFPLATVFRATFNPEDGVKLALLSGGIVLGIFMARHVIAWFQQRQITRVQITAGVALLWIFVAMLPAWLFLDINYLMGSPRLHYLASAGIAWSWGLWLTDPLPGLPRWSQIAALVAGSIIVIIGGIFIQMRVEEHQRINQIYQDAGEIALTLSDNTPENPRLLLINGPAYFAPESPYFLVGSEGSTYLPDFINPRDLLRLNGYDRRGDLVTDNRRIDDLMPGVDYVYAVTHPYLDLQTLSEYDRVAQVQVQNDRPVMLETGIQLQSADLNTPPEYFAMGILLYPGELIIQNDRPVLTVIWQRLDNSPLPPHSVFVHLLCDGQRIAGADGPPLGKLYPFIHWSEGETWQDIRYFNHSPECTGDMAALVGLYNYETGSRYPLPDGRDGVIIPLRASP